LPVITREKSMARSLSLATSHAQRALELPASTKGKYHGVLTNLYSIDSALMRQAVYTTSRFGIFLTLSDYLRKKNNGENLSFAQKGLASLSAGGIASAIGSPADLILIRMQADSMLPVEQRRNYTSVFNAARRIPAEEGITALWKGGVPTVTRAMALNFGMFTTYEEAKERFQKAMPNNKSLAWVLATISAGAMAATLSLPFDNAKTKMQKQKAGPDGRLPYKNIFDCMAKEVRNSGPAGLWVGLPTYITRIAPHVIISLTAADWLRKRLL
jgi:solute carrier family 25 (mitochondrial oxoglutarate transporter), member 11